MHLPMFGGYAEISFRFIPAYFSCAAQLWPEQLSIISLYRTHSEEYRVFSQVLSVIQFRHKGICWSILTVTPGASYHTRVCMFKHPLSSTSFKVFSCSLKKMSWYLPRIHLGAEDAVFWEMWYFWVEWKVSCHFVFQVIFYCLWSKTLSPNKLNYIHKTETCEVYLIINPVDKIFVNWIGNSYHFPSCFLWNLPFRAPTKTGFSRSWALEKKSLCHWCPTFRML